MVEVPVDVPLKAELLFGFLVDATVGAGNYLR